MLDFKPIIDEVLPKLVELRHDLHSHPELAFEEHHTAELVIDALEQLPDIAVRSGLAGGTGVLATLNSDKPGPCVLLRADMDALAMTEETGLPYQSKVDGKMHSCGHDGNTACLVGAAQVLSRFADEIPGKVKFCFQPAEECEGGGKRMVDDGVLENPAVDMAFALHGCPANELGDIVVASGTTQAAETSFDIELTGRGGHAARPHNTDDVLTAAAQIVAGSQVIRSRLIDPVNPVVLSFCQIDGGSTYNVLPETCKLKGTVRSFCEKTQEAVLENLRQYVQTTADTFRVKAVVNLACTYPPMNNDPQCADLVAKAAERIPVIKKAIREYPPSMGAEDFAFYSQKVPAVGIRVGIKPKGVNEYPGLHTSRFDFNDEAIPIAVNMHCAVVRKFFNE